jgi:hypothetical protein
MFIFTKYLGMSAETDIRVTSGKDKKRLDANENNQPQVGKNFNLNFWFNIFSLN